ncbi:MAG: primosomal protein N' [Clostridia bacterium]|nr:primosomal protein N' [Clostridia bacterium]
MDRYVNVLLSNFTKDNGDHIFTYKLKEDMDYSNIKVGMRCIVPFSAKNFHNEGYIIEIDPSINYDKSKIKEVISIPDRYVFFDEEMLSLAKFMKEKYSCELNEAIGAFVPESVRSLKQKEEMTKYISLSDSFKNLSDNDKLDTINKLKNNKAKLNQGLILEELMSYENKDDNAYNAIKLNDILSKLNIKESTITTMRKNDLVNVYSDYLTLNFDDKINKDKVENKNITTLDFTLTNAQEKVYEEIVNDNHNSNDSNEKYNDEYLLKGITGSGKTEVFIKLAKHYTSLGKNVIILVPEIGLTPQMVSRFTSNFENISIMHSKLSASEKLAEWKKVKEHKVNVIIGPRSAIFMPINNIGLIVIDEEHENTYKSEQTPKYKTYEVARYRAKYNGAKLLLASATPSSESYLKVLNKEMKLLELNERFNNKPLPEIEIVDMKEELERGNKSMFSMKMASSIKETLERNEQVILFLNRRGFSTFVSCRKCGHVMKCDHCNIPYVFHQKTNMLECHYCFSKINNVSICPNCGSKYIRHFGVGTEKVEDEIKKIFPKARVLRMDADTTREKNSQEAMLNAFKEGKYDILVGTQMIAKGHNFPNCTLVGIVAADAMLNFQDFRAAERTFQLIEQVSGRAGRADKEGRVIMQTYESDNYALEAAKNYDYDKFINEELAYRKIMNNPPYSYLEYIVFSGTNEMMVKEEIEKLAKIYKDDLKLELKGIEVLGPGPCMLSKHKDNFRYQIILRGKNEAGFDDLIRENALSGLAQYKSASKNQKNILIQLNFD